MTTIVYDHKTKTIAYDSRETRGSLISSDNTDKKILVGDQPFFMCGSYADIQELLDTYSSGGKEIAKGNEAYGYTVRKNRVYEIFASDSGHLAVIELTYNVACGSGGDFALAALDFGKSATEAVEYAKTRDVYTGGNVNTFKVSNQG